MDSDKKAGGKCISLFQSDAINELIEYSASEINQYCDRFYINGPASRITKKIWEDGVGCEIEISLGRPVIILKLHVSEQRWDKPFYLEHFSKKLDTAIVQYANANRINSIGIAPRHGNSMFFTFNDLHCPIKNNIECALGHFGIIIDDVINQLTTTNGVFIAKFNLAPEIKTACTQYLTYFTQFLTDIGIDATSETKEDAGRILFSVKPKDTSTALITIQEALQVYTNLPFSNFQKYSYDTNDTAIKQLEANINHLKEQIALSVATMKTSKAIELLALNNYKSNSENLTVKNEEKILWGIVTLKELEGKGISINIPELYRRLKRKF